MVVNIKDAVVGRNFSMLHEATHLMLREGGLCDLLEETSRAQERIEAFCNHVAGATLMSRAWILGEGMVRQHKGTQWADEEIALLAQAYRVSREAVVRRLLMAQGWYRQGEGYPHGIQHRRRAFAVSSRVSEG